MTSKDCLSKQGRLQGIASTLSTLATWLFCWGTLLLSPQRRRQLPGVIPRVLAKKEGMTTHFALIDVPAVHKPKFNRCTPPLNPPFIFTLATVLAPTRRAVARLVAVEEQVNGISTLVVGFGCVLKARGGVLGNHLAQERVQKFVPCVAKDLNQIFIFAFELFASESPSASSLSDNNPVKEFSQDSTHLPKEPLYQPGRQRALAHGRSLTRYPRLRA